ncbi:MAG: hypothetical protein ISS41_12010 [Candidatus Aminicenantes bacterium]|nr:hypothetical protein [Candidatus Aminicenantes bacterium]
MEKDNRPELPKEIELKKKLIVCPKCGAEIEVDLTIDITPITDIIGAFGAMQKPEKSRTDEEVSIKEKA